MFELYRAVILKYGTRPHTIGDQIEEIGGKIYFLLERTEEEQFDLHL